MDVPTRLFDVAARFLRLLLVPLARVDRMVARRLLRAAAATRPAVSACARLTDDAAERAAVVSERALAGLVVRAAAAVRTAVTDLLVPVVGEVHRLAEDYVLPPSARPSTRPQPRPRRRMVRGVRELALCSAVLLLLGLGAAGAGAPPTGTARVVTASADLHDRPGPWMPRRALEAQAAPPEARPAPPDLAPPSPPTLPAPLAELLAPAAPAPPTEPAPPAAPVRWLPSGTGMWLHEWHRSEGGNAQAVVARAQASGFSHLYVQTGSTGKGFIGEEVLSQLLPATVGTGLKVIAWDFPKLVDPEGDARRMAHAALWNRPGVPRVAAVAPDIETAAEGTRLSPEAVHRYYTTLRAELPPEIAILATIPWPSEKRTGFYPYAETASYSDVLVPMAYWYNRDPAVVTSTSMQYLAQFGLPVMPVGQGYDGRVDAPYLAPDPDKAGSVQKFVDAARAHGAASISLWSWQTTEQPQWDVLARASVLYPPVR